MKIALVATGNPTFDDFPDPSYGTTIQIWGMAKEFQKKGHNTTIIAGTWGEAHSDFFDGITIRYVPTPSIDSDINGIFSRFIFSWRAANTCDSGAYDVCLLRERVAGFFPVRFSTPTIYTVISPDSFEFFAENRNMSFISNILFRYKKAIEYHNLNRADRITVLNEDMVTFLKSKDINNTQYTPIGIPSNEIIESGKRVENQFIMYAGRVDSNKRVDWLVRAFKEIDAPGFRLKLIGDGPKSEELRELVYYLNLEDRVDLLGRLEREEVLNYMRSAAIKVLPSRNENSGNAVLEAMASGCPVVASNTRGPKSMISHRETGLLFQRTSFTSLVDNLQFLVDHPNERQKIGSSGRTHVENHMTMDVVSDQYIQITGDIIK